MSECVIEVGHPKGTPAVWVDSHNPDLTVCDRHKDQYDTAFDIYNIEWERINNDPLLGSTM